MVWKVVLVKTQILETGYSKLNKGFTLLELLVVLLIIGIASSVILINTSSIENVTQSRASIERNFQIISEESILSGNILGWFPDSTSQKIFILDSDGNKDTEFISGLLNNNWKSISKNKMIIKGIDGDDIELKNDITEFPAIIFYPSGENSGAELHIESEEYIQLIKLHQNGKIENETKSK